jgi:hypothetical protein
LARRALSLALFLSACGGGGGGGAATGGAIRPATDRATWPHPCRRAGGITPAEAARLAKQASFGPTPALIDHIVA